MKPRKNSIDKYYLIIQNLLIKFNTIQFMPFNYKGFCDTYKISNNIIKPLLLCDLLERKKVEGRFLYRAKLKPKELEPIHVVKLLKFINILTNPK
jgi:hypothetical protein